MTGDNKIKNLGYLKGNIAIAKETRLGHRCVMIY